MRSIDCERPQIGDAVGTAGVGLLSDEPDACQQRQSLGDDGEIDALNTAAEDEEADYAGDESRYRQCCEDGENRRREWCPEPGKFLQPAPEHEVRDLLAGSL